MPLHLLPVEFKYILSYRCLIKFTLFKILLISNHAQVCDPVVRCLPSFPLTPLCSLELWLRMRTRVYVPCLLLPGAAAGDTAVNAPTSSGHCQLNNGPSPTTACRAAAALSQHCF